MSKPRHLNKEWPTRVNDVLLSHHLADLRKSGLSNKTILAARIYSLSSKEATGPLKRKKEIGGGYAIPYIGKDGFLESDLNFKLDTPLLSEEGKKPRKYIRPFGAKAHLYIPPEVWPVIGNVKVPIFLTEGEKKALKSTECGFYTVAVSGVWNWSSDHEPINDLDLFEWRERSVYIVFDSDKHDNKSVLLAEKRLAEVLSAKGAKVKIIDLPDDGEYKLDDFLCARGAKGFEKLIDKAVDFIGSESIIVDPGDMKDITTKSWQLIHQANKGCPQIFRFGNTLAVLEPESNNAGYHITMLDNYKLRHKLTRLGNWLYYKGKRLRPYVHTVTVLEDILAVLDQGVPCLKGIAPVPVFAPDGTLVTEPGYCAKTGFFYCPPKNFILPKINRNPTAAELEVAKRWILEELLVDFPFVGRAEISHVVALLVISFVRNMIDGPTPLHLIEKSTAGTGATLLARAISYICIGGEFTVLAEGKDSEEMRKRITSVLITAPWFLVLDNLNRVLDSSALATILTATYWEDRILGQSTHLRIPVWCAWVATGNNPTLSYEITRRTIRSRLDAKTETPHLRDASQFKHYPLLPWVMENRAALVGAVLTLVQYWVAKGKPESKKSLGGFESWSAVIGGILECAGIEGFLENALDFYDDVQTEQEQKKVFVAAWYKRFKEKDVIAGELFQIQEIYDAMSGFSETTADKSAKTRLGFFIKKLKDQVFQLEFPNGLVTVIVRKSRRKIENTTAWKLEIVQRKIKIQYKQRGGQGR